MTELYKTVHRCSDPIEGEMLQDLLTKNGLAPRLLGTRNASLLGAAQHIFTLRIEVPDSQAGQAEALIQAYLEYHPVDEPEGDRDQPVLRPKTRFMAAAVVPIFPGASQCYIGRPWLGLMLAVTFFSGFFFLAENKTTYAALMILAGTMLADLFLGQIAFHRAVSRPRKSRLWQLGAGVFVSMCLLTVSLGINHLLPAYKPEPVMLPYTIYYPQPEPYEFSADDLQWIEDLANRTQDQPVAPVDPEPDGR